MGSSWCCNAWMPHLPRAGANTKLLIQHYSLEGTTENLGEGQLCQTLPFWWWDVLSSLELTLTLGIDFSFIPYLFLPAILFMALLIFLFSVTKNKTQNMTSDQGTHFTTKEGNNYVFVGFVFLNFKKKPTAFYHQIANYLIENKMFI